MFTITIGAYSFTFSDHRSALYTEIMKKSPQREQFGLVDDENDTLFSVHVSKGAHWPVLILELWYRNEAFFHPGILFVPETDIPFIGAGKNIVVYSVHQRKVLWQHLTFVGFWQWERYNQLIILSAETELRIWDIEGKECWSVLTNPPWDYVIKDNLLFPLNKKLFSISL